MDGIMHIWSLQSAPWCGWVMLGLMLCAVLSEWLQPGVIMQSSTSLLVRTERTYKEAPVNFLGQLFITLFRVGTLAMALGVCFEVEGRYRFVHYAVLCGLVVVVFLLKMLCNILIDYTFMLSRRFGAVYEHYANIMTLAVVVLYPAVLVLLRIGNPIAGQWVLGSVTILFVLMWIYRSGKTYITSPMAIFYLVVYMCTVEILPYAILYIMSEKMISLI